MKESKRDGFGSSFGMLVALAGSAVGLGNLWRFPYLVGQNGGAAFIIIYLIFVALICLPIMFSEFIIGKTSQANAVRAFQKIAPGSKWGLVGALGVLTAFLIISFYSVVGGWSIKYLFEACSLNFTRGAMEGFDTAFNNFITDRKLPVLYHFGFILLTGGVVVLGVKKGIEKFSKVMMPLLFFLVIIIAVRALTMPGAAEGVQYLFKPDFSKVTSKTVIAALGQSFFSLSLGMGTVITYASYARKDENIIKCASITAIADTVFALIAGCAIMPAVFAFGLSPQEGAGLVFVTLPYIFANMPLGGLIAILFFVALLLAALTSAISLLEVIIAFAVEEMHIRRSVAVPASLVLIMLLGALCSFSMNPDSGLNFFGKSLFDLFDYCTSNFMMTLGGILIVIFTGWKIGKKGIVKALTNDGTLQFPTWLLDVICFSIKFIAPVAVSLIVIFG